MDKVKTWKREVSFLMFVHLIYLSIWGSLEALQILVVPYMLFVTAAFGLHSLIKQGDLKF